MRTLRPRFRGGVYLPGEKAATLNAPIRVVPDPPRLFVPLCQHRGTAATAVVEPGQVVVQGQVIGRPAADDSVAVHAPAAGVVRAIEDVRLADGTRTAAVVIETDSGTMPNGKAGGLRADSLPAAGRTDAFKPHLDPADVTADNFAERFAAWGLVQMQPVGLPLHQRLRRARQTGVHTVVVNGMESEPYITADHRLTVEQTLLVALGLANLCRLTGAERGLVAVDRRRGEAADLLDRLLEEHSREHRLELGAVGLESLYPQGHELMLLKTLFDKEVEVRLDDGAGELATDRAGVCVLGVGTVTAAAEAILFDRPLTHRVVTVSGEAVRSPGNFRVPVGMPFADLLKLCDVRPPVDRLIVGGPMTGIAQPDDRSVFTKQTKGLVLFSEALVHQPGPCVRCAWCVDDCPVGINPMLLAEMGEAGRWSGAAAGHAATCIECNICTYVCPSRLPLLERIGRLKRAMGGTERRVPAPVA